MRRMRKKAKKPASAVAYNSHYKGINKNRYIRLWFKR